MTSLRLGPVHLTVADLERSVAHYRDAIGLRELGRDGATARMGVDGRELVVLVEEAGARPAPHSTGLFHLALLLPTRADLARWLGHAARERIALTGLSDHLVSEAIYLQDPDGHGIEIYADRPRDQWHDATGALRLTTIPLDVEDLMRATDDPSFDAMPAGTTMGHVHLQVADVEEAVAFYTRALGVEVMARYGAQAAFLGADGYHHHIGVNTWNSRGAGPPPAGSAALRHFTVQLAAPGPEGELRDPSGTRLVVQRDGR